MSNNVVLIDANAFVYKSYHGYMPMLDGAQKDQKVLMGLMQTLYDVIKHVDNISYLYFVFDGPDSSLYRKSLYPAYKENRPPTPAALIEQRNHAKKVLRSEVGVPVIDYPGYEADDVIGTMAQFYKKDYNVIVVSPDKDLFQLIDEKVMLLRPTKKENRKVYEYISQIGVERYFGVSSAQIPDFLALVGDTADNLPGVDKVGNKTASYLLKKYSSIEGMFVLIEELKKTETDYAKFMRDLEDNIEVVKLVKMLATIKTDLDVMTHMTQSLELAHNTQSTPAHYAKLELLAEYYKWKPHFIQMFK